MTSDALMQAIHTRPFRPFVMKLVSGRSIRVAHPEMVAMSAGGRTIAVFEPDSEGPVVADQLLVETIEYAGSDRKRRKSA